MKKLTILITALSLLIACEKAIYNFSEEPYLIVENYLDDITLEEGEPKIEMDISEVFKVEGDDKAQILKSIYSIQNIVLVSAELTGDILSLTANIGETGSSEIVIRAEWSSTVIFESFIFTVESIVADTALNKAIQYFQNHNYDSAETFFRILISKNNTQLQSDAYMGLGFSQMRNNNAPEAYLSLQSSISENVSNNDAKAGLSLLEYSYTKNYSEAIRYGQEVLAASSNFVFRYDTNLNYNDILVNIALSQYSSQLFDDCLTTIQQLDAAFILSPSDPDYKTKLYQKLEELLLLYG